MARFLVTEEVQYEYEADSQEHAIQLCTDDADRDEKCVAVTERWAEEIDD